MKKHRFIQIADIILIVSVLICAFLFMTSKNTNDPCVAIIYVDGQEYKRIDLEKNIEDQLIEIGNVKIYVSGDGTVKVNQSDCPDKVCMNGGAISKAGSTIACVPNKIVITIVKNNNYVDGVTG